MQVILQNVVISLVLFEQSPDLVLHPLLPHMHEVFSTIILDQHEVGTLKDIDPLVVPHIVRTLPIGH